jgi:hypothetical protein
VAASVPAQDAATANAPNKCAYNAYTYKKTYQFKEARGVNWYYNPPVYPQENSTLDNIPPNFTKQQGIDQCKSSCDLNLNCRSFAWVNTTFLGSTYRTCVVSPAPFASQSWLFQDLGSDAGTPVQLVSEAYTVTNFRVPDEPLINGDFKTGCYPPWTRINVPTGVTSEVVACKSADKCPEDNTKYAHIYGTPYKYTYPNSAINNVPAFNNNTKYALSFWALGTQGQLSFGDGEVLYNATGKWKKYSSTSKWIYGEAVYIAASYIRTAPRTAGPFDWKITGVTLEEA